MFKKDDNLICIDNKDVGLSLTVGKIYIVTEYNKSFSAVKIIDDRSLGWGFYDVKFFKLHRKDKIERILHEIHKR